MEIFRYPQIILTILVFCFILFGILGVIYFIKSIRTANGREEKGIMTVNRLDNEFDKLSKMRKKRSVIYISVSADRMSRLYSDVKAQKIISQIQNVLFENFSKGTDSGFARYLNSSFVVLNVLETDEIQALIEKSNSLVNEIIKENEAVNNVKITFGFYQTDSTEVTFSTALSRAKQAFQMAENESILYVQWDNVKSKALEKKIKIENNIQSEIDNNRFFLEYQPIIDVKTNKVVGAEVLSRLNSEKDGILTPGVFLSAVSNVGLIKKFDFYIFEKNCKWIASDKTMREKYVYTVNFSRSTVCCTNFCERIFEVVEKYGINYKCIGIEILEDKELSSQEEKTLGNNVTCLTEKGVSIFLDDFGSGHTSFTDLSSFDVTVVKIDKKLIRNAEGKAGMLILENVVRTARELGFKTLCEGIETEEQKAKAEAVGCDFLQGFYFYKPMSVVKFEELL